MQQALRRVYREDPEANLQKALATAFSDDLRPIGENGRWKPSPVVVLVGSLVLILVAVFIYFSFGGQG